MRYHAVEPFGSIAGARRDSFLWSAALPPLYRMGGYEAPDYSPDDLLAIFGFEPEPLPPPLPQSLEDERAQMERDSYAFAAQMKRGSS